MQHKWSCYWLV